METIFYRVKKHGRGWSIIGQKTIDNRLIRYGDEADKMEWAPPDTKTLAKLKLYFKKENNTIVAVPIYYDLTAPGELIQAIYIGTNTDIRKKFKDSPRTILSEYLYKHEWVDQLTADEYHKYYTLKIDMYS